MIAQWGVGYGGYHRLRVAAVGDEIAQMLTRAGGFEAESDQFLAVRHLVRAWRERAFTLYRDPQNPEWPTENAFLLRYDISYRIRRLLFLRRVIEQRRYDRDDNGVPSNRDDLFVLSRLLGYLLKRLRTTRERLTAAGRDNPLHQLMIDVGITPEHLVALLREPSFEGRLSLARALLDEGPRREALGRLATEMAKIIRGATAASSKRAERLLQPEGRSWLLPYFQHYDEYDMLTFPVLYGTDVGEIGQVDIIRVSPEDATSLMNERIEPTRRKLAGTRFLNFASFLDRTWRQNDMLWGRLDAAERIITALLPPGDDRTELIRQAQYAILGEDVRPEDDAELSVLLADALAATEPTNRNEAALAELVAAQPGAPVNVRLQAALRGRLEDAPLLAFLRERYEVSRALTPRIALDVMSRSTRVIGKMLEGLADTYRLDRRGAAWVTRLGTAFWGMVEVAVPQSFTQVLFLHWQKLLLLFGVLLVVSSVLLNNPAVTSFGTLIVVLALAARTAVWLLQDYIEGGRLATRTAKGIAVAFLLFLLLRGAVDVPFIARDVWSLWPVLGTPSFVRGTGILALALTLVVLAGRYVVASVVRGKPAAADPTQVPPADEAQPEPLPNGFHSPILALELARTAAEARQVIGQEIDDPRREKLSLDTWLDFLFIAGYWSLFLALSVTMLHSHVALLPWLGGAAALCATGAAVCDVVENVRILGLLNRRLPHTPTPAVTERAAAIYRAAVAKWSFTFMAVALLSLLFLLNGRAEATFDAIRRAGATSAADVAWMVGAWLTGGLFLIAAVIGIGCIDRINRGIEWAFWLLVLALPLGGVVLTLWPGYLP
jgi:hypothetical protein